MLIDARELPRRGPEPADVCIVGAGAAGIALARALAGGGRQVLLLESGGLELDAETQALHRGENVGQPYAPLDGCRLRFFGGTTNHWAGYSRPLDPVDFRERPWMPYSGWPFERPELEPYYAAAERVLELSPGRWDAGDWARAASRAPLALEPDVFASRIFQLSPPTRFGALYREELARAPGVRVLLHANAVEIETTPDGRSVEGLRVKTLAGGEWIQRARRYVLATGGIENARLLLASRSGAHSEGVGNGRDLVGRFFMEHPHLIRAYFLPSDPELEASFYKPSRSDAGRFIGVLALHEDVLRREGINQVSATLNRSPRKAAAYLEAETSAGMTSLKYLAGAWRRGVLPDDLGTHLWRVLADLDDIAVASWGRGAASPEAGWMYEVFFRTEQTPNPDSRVRLSGHRDALGMPRVELDWQLEERDLRTMERGHELLGRELGRAGLGRLFFPGRDPERTWVRDIFGGSHHMGTTRMHRDPALGVVDADGRVHGVDNLYVAGSSVFPTTGYANPTLTLVALALRLGDHLRGLPA